MALPGQTRQLTSGRGRGLATRLGIGFGVQGDKVYLAPMVESVQCIDGMLGGST